jgi:rare lipoprotein A
VQRLSNEGVRPITSYPTARGARRRAGLVVLFGAAFAACAPVSPPPQPPAPVPEQAKPAETFVQVGLASWYGSFHAGLRTASGELFDPDAMTAAHRTLPLGTVVRVTNIANDRAVTVRINDRGPRDRSRIIDLSRSAAQVLGFQTDGIMKVKIERVVSN